MAFKKIVHRLIPKKNESGISFEYSSTEKKYISSTLEENIEYVKKTLKNCDDVIYRNVHIRNHPNPVCIIYIEGMADKNVIDEEILQALMFKTTLDKEAKASIINDIKDYHLSASQVQTSREFSDLLCALLSGDTLLFSDGCDTALIIGSIGWAKRDISEPSSEQTVRGSREGFVEALKTNIVLIRRRIKHPDLSIEIMKVGRKTKTDIGIIYLKGIINDSIVNKLKTDISSIDTDGIVGSAQIEQLLEKYKWTIFPQTLATERVDKAVGSILEGRAMIVVDGTPFVLIVPSTFGLFINSPDDYYERSIVTSVTRMIRYLCYILSATLPALYLALTAYHPGMIPTQLALSITGSRIGLPFPTIVEVLIMGFTIEAITEASIRLPKPMGQTVSIVGGLVIGQAAVQAGFIAPLLVIVTALTAITSYAIPVYTFVLSNRILRLLLVLSASLWGLYGIIMTWIFILIHMASLESFGVRFLADYSPYRFNSLKDTIMKVPQTFMNYRPEILHTQDEKRQDPVKSKGD